MSQYHHFNSQSVLDNDLTNIMSVAEEESSPTDHGTVMAAGNNSVAHTGPAAEQPPDEQSAAQPDELSLQHLDHISTAYNMNVAFGPVLI